MNPRFPLFIVSKGRYETRLTSDTLEKIGAPYRMVIEEQEYKKYSANVDKKKLLVLDKTYQQDYDTFDDLKDEKSKGPGAARNFVWDYSISEGHDWHWVMDDNIRNFYRLYKNQKISVGDPTCFRVMEDFCLRYTNIGMAGPNYHGFCNAATRLKPFVPNTRIYSCNLIRNDTPFRWRGRYNEDTDLSLRMLKGNWATVQFNAFLQGKVVTQSVKGGNTKEFYAHEGTMAKSQMQVKMHPDVSKLVWKFNRWHHTVDYRPFRWIPLIKKENSEIKAGVNDFGMKLKKVPA